MSLPADLSVLQDGRAAEGEAGLEALEKQLVCPICLELFNKPVVILPCQHNLCRKCANELYQPSLFQARTTMMVNSGRFRCPTCRHEVVLDRHGVYGLPRNLLVENIIDVYKQDLSSSHAPSVLPPAPPPAQLTCQDHEGEKVNIYCLTCRAPTCSLCKVFGAHRSCEVAPLSDVYQQQKEELSEAVRSLVTVNDRIQTVMDELEETCRRVEENCAAQKQSVCDLFQRLASILGQRHQEMTQQISSEEQEKTAHAQALVRRYGDSVEANAKLMERAASSMDEPDLAAFVQSSRELITEVTAASGSCPTETLEPGYENLRPYDCNFSRQERALKSIDFPKAVEEVPEEPDVEPEEPTAPSEPKHHQEPCVQNPEPEEEPDKDTTPEEPAPELLSDPEEPAGAAQITEEKKVEGEEAEGWAAPDSIKDTNTCEGEGLSIQQGGEPDRVTADWTTQRETEGEPEEQEEDGEEEEEEEQQEESDVHATSDLQVQPRCPQSGDDSQLPPGLPLLPPADQPQSPETEHRRAGEAGFVEESAVEAEGGVGLRGQSLTPEERSSGILGDGGMEEQSRGEVSGLSQSGAERTGTGGACGELRDDKEAREEPHGGATGSEVLEDGENSRRRVDESEEKVTSCVSLQAVTLLFYLLAFLLILQNVWVYIGCFICT